jgi:YgiT-type zinc finger domain-containing protein
MNNDQEQLIEKRVTYSLELDGKFILIENVPARVNEETGEQFFAPSTVMFLQQIILEGQEPKRVIQTPVYSYAA